MTGFQLFLSDLLVAIYVKTGWLAWLGPTELLLLLLSAATVLLMIED